MAKVIYKWGLLGLLTLCGGVAAAQRYVLQYVCDDSVQLQALQLTSRFANRFEASTYVGSLLPLLQGKGFVTASVDKAELDSAEGRVWLFLGEPYRWGIVKTDPADATLLQTIRFPTLKGKLDFSTLGAWQKKILDQLEEEGHPFGKTFLDSISFVQNELSAVLRIDRGPVYRIDSLQVFGDAKVSPQLLQRHLGIASGSLYNRRRLEAVSSKLAELSYVEEEKPFDLTMHPTGSVLNLYLKSRRNSQINALVGLQPNTQQLSGERSFQLTVDANVLLKNALGAGETIAFVWQQLQRSSPRLNLLYEHPYLFQSPFGATFSLDMYKRDSIFLNINMNLGAVYRLAERKAASVFLQRRQSVVSGINAGAIIATRQLPQEADVSSLNLGVGYEFNSTDYRPNPRRGHLLTVSAAAGTKRIKRNNLILELKDPVDPSFRFSSLYDTMRLQAYQVRITTNAAQFVPLGRQTTLKLGANIGVFQSANYFRNELFQIGGFRLLRGFDEESQFVSKYAVGTVEFRLLTGLNSNFFAFVDGGWGRYPLDKQPSHTYISGGAGLSFQPKAGLINVTWAVGRRDDVPFNLRQSKIHIGFVSFF